MMYLNFKKSATRLFLICLLFIVSCTKSETETNTETKYITKVESKYSDETKHFKSYLKSMYNKSLSNDKVCYLIIPDNGCNGCRHDLLKFMLGDGFTSKFRGIVSSPNEKTFNLINKKENIFIDDSGLIDRLNIQTEGTVMIVTESNNITNIVPITPDNMNTFMNI